jgi:hypothetical protein
MILISERKGSAIKRESVEVKERPFQASDSRTLGVKELKAGYGVFYSVSQIPVQLFL